jgi:hypothetical protein
MPPEILLNKILYKPDRNSNCNNKKMFSMYRFLTAFILITSLLVQSCSKKINNDPAPPPPGPVENANLN